MSERFTEVILDGEERLLARIVARAEAGGFLRGTSREPEAWRAAVRGISGSLIQGYRSAAEAPAAPGAEDAARETGITAFAVVEARRHRLAGMPLAHFLGIAKIFRHAYGDLVRSAGLPPVDEARYRAYLDRFFDRNEIACSASWAEESGSERTEELTRKHDDLSSVHHLVAAAKVEWEHAIDCVDDMLLLVDSHGRLRRCNRAFRDFTGKEYEALLDRPCPLVLRDAGLPAEIAPGLPVEHFSDRTGEWFVLNRYPCAALAPEDALGEVIVIHNATRIKRAARDLERHAERVQGALSRLRATHAIRLAQGKAESVGRLAAGLSEDLNRPAALLSSNLRTLTAYLERLKGFLTEQSACIAAGAPSARVEAVRKRREQLRLDHVLRDLDELLSESLDGAERVNTIVSDLKAFAPGEPGAFREADVNACLRDAVRRVRPGLADGAAFTADLGTIPPTRAVPGDLTRAFERLLGQAARAVGPRGAIAVRSWAADGYVCVSVTDSGAEIPAERLERVFDPFYAARRIGPADGMGLSIAQDIVRRHQGEIRVASATGRGTTFTVRLPILAEA